MDTFVGGAGNDTFNGIIDGTTGAVATTLTALDNIDGGAGTDTFTLNVLNGVGAAGIAVAGLPAITVKNIENAVVRSAVDLTADFSDWAGLTSLSVTEAAGDIALTAEDTTAVTTSGTKGDIAIEGGSNITVTDATADNDITIGATTQAVGTITVTDTKAGDGAIAIDGGTDVTVTASGVADVGAGAITIGAAEAATGAVTVTSTGAAYDPAAAGGTQTLSDIAVTGGTTISVTQVATSDASKAASDTSAGTITQGNITIVADDNTTDVTVKQDAAVSVKHAANSTGGATETVSVVFDDLAATDTIILGGLTLTAVEDMTAEEVAQAFANLSKDAAIPTAAAAADGDTQSAAVASKAVYSGSIDNWTTGAADGDTVVFTYGTANAVVGAALAETGTGDVTSITVLTTGKAHDATPTGGRAVVVAGDVDITGDAALTTVTVDGYGALGNDQIQGASNDALATINLANGGHFDIASAAATLALNLVNVGGTVDVAAGTTTLNADVSGAATATLVSASAKNVNISGTGKVNDGGTALAAATAINTTGMTAGTAAFDIDGTKTTYTGGAGADTVTLAAGAALSKAIDLGAGNDTLVLAADTASSTAVLSGGEGTDTLSMGSVRAAALDGSEQTFYTNFERLLINDNTNNGLNINLENLGFTDYVTVAGSDGTVTLSNLVSGGTVVQTAAATTGITVVVDDAANSTTDVLNYVLSSSGALAAGVLTAANVETINLNSDDTNTTAHVNTLTLTADKATTLNIEGDAGLTLTLTGSNVLKTIDAGDMTGDLTVTGTGQVAMTITGGAGDDTLTASAGATAKADVLIGGAGDDTLVAGSNGAKLTGGAGNDIFILSDSLADGTGGNLEANTYSIIEDFSAGDLLQLTYYDGAANQIIAGLNGLEANLNDDTAVFGDFVTAAMEQIAALESGGGQAEGQAVWFDFKDNLYVVVESNGAGDGSNVTGTFDGNEDLIIRVNGVSGADLSFNSDFGTLAFA